MKRALVIFMAVVLCAGAVGSSFAYFTDLETSTANTFAMGTLGLEIKDNCALGPDGWGDGLDRTWTMSPMEPEVSYVTNDVTLRENGTIPGDHVEVSFSSSIDEQTAPPGENPLAGDINPVSLAQDLGKWLEVTSMLYSGDDLIWRIIGVDLTPGWDVNGNGWLDLDDLVRSPAIIADHGPLDDLLPPNLTGGEGALYMTVMFHVEATTDIAGDVLTTVVSFTLNHNASQ